MNKNLSFACVAVSFFVVLFVSCRKDGLNSSEAKKIQYRWERISASSGTQYPDGRPVYWHTKPATPNTYLEFDADAFFYDIAADGSSARYQYAVDGEKILYLALPLSYQKATTPQYTDTTFISYVDDHLLVLSHSYYYHSGAYSYTDLYIDSLKK